MLEGVHGFERFGFPVGNGLGGVFIEAEMLADIEREIMLVALIAEERVALADGLFVHERGEARHFGCLCGQTPGVEVEVEFVVVDNELLEPLDFFVGLHRVEFAEPVVVLPLPDARRHDIGQH